jgi:hypothetical protein
MKSTSSANRGRLVLPLAMVALAGVSAATAATITQTVTTGQLTTDVTNDALAFTDFNSSLGTLNSVVVTLGGNIERDLFFKNTSTSSPATISVTDWTTSFGLTGPDGTSLTTSNNATPSLSVAQYNAQPGSPIAVDNGTTTTIGGTTFTDSHLVITAGGPGTYTDVGSYSNTSTLTTQSQTITSNLSSFVGNTTFNADANLSYGATGGNNYSRFRTLADGMVTVTYNYTPVPVPRGRLADALRIGWSWHIDPPAQIGHGLGFSATDVAKNPALCPSPSVKVLMGSGRALI